MPLTWIFVFTKSEKGCIVVGYAVQLTITMQYLSCSLFLYGPWGCAWPPTYCCSTYLVDDVVLSLESVDSPTLVCLFSSVV